MCLFGLYSFKDQVGLKVFFYGLLTMESDNLERDRPHIHKKLG